MDGKEVAAIDAAYGVDRVPTTTEKSHGSREDGTVSDSARGPNLIGFKDDGKWGAGAPFDRLRDDGRCSRPAAFGKRQEGADVYRG